MESAGDAARSGNPFFMIESLPAMSVNTRLTSVVLERVLESVRRDIRDAPFDSSFRLLCGIRLF